MNNLLDQKIFLGKHPETEQLAHMLMLDTLTHTVGTGTTGSGKTVFGANMVMQIWAKCGGSCVVIEPTENLIKDILSQCPPRLYNKITILDIASTHPIQLKWTDEQSDRAVAVQAMMNAVRLNEPASWDSAPRMKQYLRHAFNLVLDVEQENASITHVMRWLNDDKYRQHTIDKASAYLLESKQFAQKLQDDLEKKKGKSNNSFDSARTRVDGFILNDLLRHSVSVPPIHGGVDLWKLLTTPGQLILVPFKKSGMGEEVRHILGTHIIQSVIRICKARDKSYTQSAPVALVIDELMNVINGSDSGTEIKEILSETRQDGLGSILLFQLMAQMPPDVQKFIGSLANTKIVLMQRDRDSAKPAINGFKSKITVDRVMEIKKWHGLIERMVNREVQPLEYLSMLPPIDLSNDTLQGGYPSEPTPEMETAIRLLKPYYAQKGDDNRIQYLESLSDDQWAATVNAQSILNKRKSELLYYKAQTETNTEKRVQMAREIAMYRDGFHRNWLEVWYRKLRIGGDGSKQQKAVKQVRATTLPQSAQQDHSGDLNGEF